MIEFLIDVNLPFKFRLWDEERFQHVREINDEWLDSQIWNYAKKKCLTIVTKDTDFSNRIITTEPPPKIIHLRIGNMRMADFHSFINSNLYEIERLNTDHKLVTVFPDRIIGID